MRRSLAVCAATVLLGGTLAAAAVSAQAASKTYDIRTLAGKVASLRGTAGLQIRFSAFIEEEAQDTSAAPNDTPRITSERLATIQEVRRILREHVVETADQVEAPATQCH